MLVTQLNTVSNNLTEITVNLFRIPTIAELGEIVLKRLRNKLLKQIKSLDIALDELIQSLDKVNIEELKEGFSVLSIVAMIFDMLERIEFEPLTDDDKVILIKLKNAISKFSDIADAIEQCIDENGAMKISEYILLIQDYRASRDDNLEIAHEFESTDLQNWQ